MKAPHLVAAILLALPGLASAQLPTIAPDARDAAFGGVQKRFAAELATAQDKKAVYRRMFEALIQDENLYPKLSPAQYRGILQAQAANYRRRIRESAAELRESAVTPSVNATASNPTSNQLVERAGATEVLALAADLRKLFSADQSAVTLNLNAFGLVRGGSTSDVDAGAQHFYSQGEHWRRLTGSVTFGAKIPEKEITGLSGLPDADKLFDAMAWDVKFRFYGDRDPRASRWYGLFIDRLGTIDELAALLVAGSIVPPADLNAATEAANEVLGEALATAANHVANSWVVSGKFSGQHLTNVAGKNKYSSTIIVDRGLSNVDFTANSTFNWADVPASGGTPATTTKNWLLSAALTGSVLKDALVANRAAELSASVTGTIPMNDVGAAADRKRIIKLNATVTLPFQEKGTIPLSFTFSNDPNNLTKEKYVSGQIGISYDFGALKSLLK